MKKIELDELRTFFESKRKELIASLENSTANAEVDYDGDETDMAQGVLINAIRERQSERDILRLKRINIAIEKIDSGDFGECEECGEQISKNRLKAVPGCTMCIGCAEIAEKSAKQLVS